MQTNIHPALIARDDVREADEILRSCVHCGFCTAVCPTYQLLGDELDGPRGRIYLVKDMLERDAINAAELVHLDRCLTCRACETACPSGVEYGRLMDIGRGIIEEKTRRPLPARVVGTLLRKIVPYRKRFGSLLRLGQWFVPVLPRAVARRIPPPDETAKDAPDVFSPAQRVLLLGGCAQSAATPGVNRAAARVLARQNIAADVLAEEGCCGAVDYHLPARDVALDRMRTLIDQLDERLDEVDVIVSTASGCGVTIKEYPRALKHDSVYFERANRVADKVVDIAELLAGKRFDCAPITAAFHAPCSLQHGQKITGVVETILTSSGIRLTEVGEAHLCCGSAGAWSLMHPSLSERLLERKVGHLESGHPEVIATANVGCQMHLASGTSVPVMHWIQLLDRQLDGPTAE